MLPNHPIEERLASSAAEKPKSKPGKSLPPYKFNLSWFLPPLSVLAFLAIIFLIPIFNSKPSYISPLPEQKKNLPAVKSRISQKQVIGFLPFWNLKEEQNQRYHLLSQVAFFALDIEADGAIKKLQKDGSQEPGWTAYKSSSFGTIYRKAKNSGAKVILTIKSTDPEVIAGVVNHPQNRSRLIKETMEIMDLKNLDGINIDFEINGAADSQTRKNFSTLISEWRQAFDAQNRDLTLSIDVFADAARKKRLWDVAEISPFVDYIVIMAYDFHRVSSQKSGPIAPIHGAPEKWNYDLSKTLNDFSKKVPLDKIILGVAYYGYEWQTLNEDPYSLTYPGSGATATYKRIQSLISQKPVKLKWDETALSPYLSYIQNGNIYQIYYENEASLGIKYDLVNESGLAGIGIWALGYDSNHPNLWNLIIEKLPHNQM